MLILILVKAVEFSITGAIIQGTVGLVVVPSTIIQECTSNSDCTPGYLCTDFECIPSKEISSSYYEDVSSSKILNKNEKNNIEDELAACEKTKSL
ncbi:MAG: hypothetical protein PHU12_01300 [Candidatus Aenigmarchaeota archaeon]|nr:hypothetical protein [Candidatus Aenigmarchaeota archaeon]